jgi:hypothetical protein
MVKVGTPLAKLGVFIKSWVTIPQFKWLAIRP